MLFTAHVECPVYDSFRVQQVAGLFDLPPAEKCRQTFQVELPGVEEDWQIGAIVGPSGSGKSTVARQAFGAALYEPHAWPADRAVIDGFGDLPIKTITQALTAVGFSSPPSWIKPYSVLSNGEKFRCDLARSLLGGSVSSRLRSFNPKPTATASVAKPNIEHDCLQDLNPEPFPPEPSLVVFDEFSSVVDRTVAQIGSAAVARAIRMGRMNGGQNTNSNANVQRPRRGNGGTTRTQDPSPRPFPRSTGAREISMSVRSRTTTPQATSPPATSPPVTPPLTKFIAVSCHYDILPWLEPDWVLDLAAGRLQWGRLRRPDIQLDLHRASRTAWALFAKHHYLNPGLSAFASCFVAYWNERPVAFVAVLPMAGHKGRRRISRVVVLPDYQGVGIGGRVTTAVAQQLAAEGMRVSITSSHPAMIGWLRHTSDWRITGIYRSGGHAHKSLQHSGSGGRGKRYQQSAGRALVSAIYVPT